MSRLPNSSGITAWPQHLKLSNHDCMHEHCSAQGDKTFQIYQVLQSNTDMNTHPDWQGRPAKWLAPLSLQRLTKLNSLVVLAEATEVAGPAQPSVSRISSGCSKGPELSSPSMRSHPLSQHQAQHLPVIDPGSCHAYGQLAPQG